MSIEAMKLALEAIDTRYPGAWAYDVAKCIWEGVRMDAIRTLRQAIEQAEKIDRNAAHLDCPTCGGAGHVRQAEKQEPVVLVSVTSGAKIKLLGPFHKLPGGEHLLYAAPQPVQPVLAEPKEPEMHPVLIGVEVTYTGAHVTASYNRPDATPDVFYSHFHPIVPQPAQQSPTGWGYETLMAQLKSLENNLTTTQRGWFESEQRFYNLSQAAADGRLADLLFAKWAALLHYPQCWDTEVYPTVQSAIDAALTWRGCNAALTWRGCSACNSGSATGGAI